VDRVKIVIGGLPRIRGNVHVINVDHDVYRGAIRVVLDVEAGVVLAAREALLDELYVQRAIPDAACVTLSKEWRLEPPYVINSTMVSSAEAWWWSKMALLKHGRLALQMGMGDVEPKVATARARLSTS
jgi:hypothetical protein